MAVAHTLPTEAVIADIADFDHRSGSLPERLLFNNRFIVVAVCLLVTVVLAYQAMGLRLNAAFEKMIPTSHPYIVNYLENRSQLAGMGNSLRIAVETKSGDIFSADYLETVRQLNDELFLMPEVDRPYMKSLWAPAVRWTGVT
ncbi:transporter, partial [Thauera sp. 63]